MAYASNPALTYTVDQFINLKMSDEMTFRNFSILEVVEGLELYDHNLVEDYLEELDSICAPVELDTEQYGKYKYAPDLLAYDIYGTTQLDFIILYANGIFDPKDFIMKTVKLPYARLLREYLSEIYNGEQQYLKYNRSQNGLTDNVL